jgi:hypothetical protein
VGPSKKVLSRNHGSGGHDNHARTSSIPKLPYLLLPLAGTAT